MATYYVSATDGSDSDDGSTAALAFATIGAGENAADTAGDIVYIAPGTYRELVVHGYSGTAGRRIYFIGDPDCEHFPDVQPGVVRVTAAAADTEFASNTTGLYIIKTNGKDYITWKNVHVDGGSGGIDAYNDANSSYAFYANSETDYMECINCMAQSISYGFFNIYYSLGCTVMNSHGYGFYNGVTMDRCISFSSFGGARGLDLIKNSIIISAYYTAFYCDEIQNCILMGGYLGAAGSESSVNQPEDYIYDSIFMSNYYGTYASSNSVGVQVIVSGSYYIGNYYMNRYGEIHGNGMGTTYRQWVGNTDPIVGLGGASDMQGDGTIWPQKGITLWSINDTRKIIEGFKPSLYSKAIQGCTTTERDSAAGTVDILGNPRKMGQIRDIFFEPNGTSVTSSRDIGPYELSNIELTGSYSSKPPAFLIEDEGMFTFPIAVSGSTTTIASIDVKHQSGSGTGVKPQFILRYAESYPSASATSAEEYLSGSDLYIQTVTSTANDNTWETLTVSHSSDISRELELVVYNQQTGSATSSFSDLEIR